MSPDYRKSNPGMFNLLFGAYGFPVGLCLVIINGASLFTSNIAYMMAAYIEGKATSLQSLWIVWLSYFTNLCGEFQLRFQITIHQGLLLPAGSALQS